MYNLFAILNLQLSRNECVKEEELRHMNFETAVTTRRQCKAFSFPYLVTLPITDITYSSITYQAEFIRLK
jgi:hypothetical protein